MEQVNFANFYKENIGLIRTATRKVMSRALALGTATMDYDDMEQELTLIFIDAYKHYDPSKYKFSTYYMRAAFNRANYLLKKVYKERINNGVRSVEEMGSWAEDNDDGLSMTVEDVMAVKPEEQAQIKSLMRTWNAQLSPLGQLIMSWTLEPPEWLEHEFEAQKVHAEISRSLGVTTRSRAELNAAYVVFMLKQVFGYPHAFDNALKEIQHVARHTL